VISALGFCLKFPTLLSPGGFNGKVTLPLLLLLPKWDCTVGLQLITEPVLHHRDHD
jgi:hypothetical protein